MSKLEEEEKKGAETSFEVRPLFRAYDRRELGLPTRALSRFGSIRLVDAFMKSKSHATPAGRGEIPQAIRCQGFIRVRPGTCDGGLVNILCSPRKTLNPRRNGNFPTRPATLHHSSEHPPSHRLAATRKLVRPPGLPRRLVPPAKTPHPPRPSTSKPRVSGILRVLHDWNGAC